MDLTNINLYAEGEYSNNTYEDNIVIRRETYEKLKNQIKGIKCYITELDGKHSEVRADITITHYSEEEILDMTWDSGCDGDDLKETLGDIFAEQDLDLEEEQKIVNEYLSSLDTYVNLTIKVRHSNVEKVQEFCAKL